MNSRKFRKSEKDMVNIPLDETDGLAKQDKDNINLEELTAATPEVISRQVCRLVILWICPLCVSIMGLKIRNSRVFLTPNYKCILNNTIVFFSQVEKLSELDRANFKEPDYRMSFAKL